MSDEHPTTQEEAFDIAESAETSTLYGVIDRDKVFGLNLTIPEDAKELIKPWDARESVDKWVDSGVDDQVCPKSKVVDGQNTTHRTPILVQLIIHVPFSQNVKIRSILIKPGDCLYR